MDTASIYGEADARTIPQEMSPDTTQLHFLVWEGLIFFIIMSVVFNQIYTTF